MKPLASEEWIITLPVNKDGKTHSTQAETSLTRLILFSVSSVAHPFFSLTYIYIYHMYCHVTTRLSYVPRTANPLCAPRFPNVRRVNLLHVPRVFSLAFKCVAHMYRDCGAIRSCAAHHCVY